MPPLHSNPNVIVPDTPDELRDLEAREVAGELDGFQLWVHPNVDGDGGVGIPAFVQRDADYHQIAPAILEEGISKGPLYGWAGNPTKERHPYGYGNDVGTSPAALRKFLIETGRLAPNWRANVADKIRQLFGHETKYDLFRPRDYSKDIDV